MAFKNVWFCPAKSVVNPNPYSKSVGSAVVMEFNCETLTPNQGSASNSSCVLKWKIFAKNPEGANPLIFILKPSIVASPVIPKLLVVNLKIPREQTH